MCAVYQYTFWSIRNEIYSKPRRTEFDNKVFQHQEKTLDRLRTAVLWFCIVSWYLILSDVIALIIEMFNSNKNECDNLIFSGSMEWANSIIWFISRIITNLSPQLFALYMFYKKTLQFKKREYTRKVVDPKTNKTRFVGSDAEEILGTFEKTPFSYMTGESGIDDLLDERATTNIR